jgi:hypothetical protein
MLQLISDSAELALWGLTYAVMPHLSQDTTLTRKTITLAIIATLLFTLTYTLFDQATWYFAYHYYNC